MSRSRRTLRARATSGSLLGSALVVALAPLSVAVHAANAAAGEGESSRRQIEEVIVTAEKRESTIQDTSISISAFDGEFLADFGIRNQEDLANFIPATTIQPYDMAVRGIGRSFRALGGDPGISTYLDGVYSEDFGIASTEGGLFDVERIEVLRGPQGTLYGRNAIGGAINFISKKPTDEFEGEVKTNFGTEGLVEYYGVVSGPIIEGVLNARANGVKRERDGYYEDLTPGNKDVGNYGDENYSLSLEFMPLDNVSFLVRGNERSYRRRMGGASTSGIIALNENGGQGRDTTTEVFGYRPILSSNTDPLAASFDASQGAAALAATGNANLNLANPVASSFLNPAGELFSFTNPRTNETILAQRLRPGVDPATVNEPSRNFGGGPGGSFAIGPTADADDFTGDDLVTATNGNNDEFFDHQAVSFQANWDVNDWLSTKYIFGYTDYFYDRTTDQDLTGNPNADETFYVSQENENFQHEFQFFFDFGDRATLTSGLFFYEARIDQRGDFYSSVAEPRYAAATDYGSGGVTGFVLDAVLGNARPDLFAGKQAYNALDAAGQAEILNGDTLNVAGIWTGDNAAQAGGCSALPNGPVTCGSFTEYATISNTEAFAFYNQAEIFLSDQFSLTLGLRYAEDERSGEENVFLYSEQDPGTANLAQDPANFALPEVLLLSAIDSGLASGGPANGTSLLAPGVLPVTPTGSLLQYNISTGAIDPATLQQTGNATTRLQGVPFGISFYRPVKETFDDITWRVNLDWEPNDTTLLYAGVTTGYRAGGFNLANLSDNATYDSEEITAYEIGWKDQLFDRTVQLNMSAYFYDYENIHASVDGQSAALGATVNNVRAIPTAEIFGVEADVLWLATENLTLGGNFSFTDSEYTSDLTGAIDFDGDGTDEFQNISLTQNEFDASLPASLFRNPAERVQSIEGNQLLLVPEIKWTLFGMYNHPLANGSSVEGRTTLSYTDEVFFSVENNPEDQAPEYYRWDARLTWTSPTENIIVSGFVNNILDDIGVRQITRTAESQNYLRSAVPTDPRLMGIELTYRFGAYR